MTTLLCHKSKIDWLGLVRLIFGMVLVNENTKVLDFMWNIYSILGSVSTQRFGAEKSWPLLLHSRSEPHANPCCTQSNQVEAGQHMYVDMYIQTAAV